MDQPKGQKKRRRPLTAEKAWGAVANLASVAAYFEAIPRAPDKLSSEHRQAELTLRVAIRESEKWKRRWMIHLGQRLRAVRVLLLSRAYKRTLDGRISNEAYRTQVHTSCKGGHFDPRDIEKFAIKTPARIRADGGPVAAAAEAIAELEDRSSRSVIAAWSTQKKGRRYFLDEDLARHAAAQLLVKLCRCDLSRARRAVDWCFEK